MTRRYLVVVALFFSFLSQAQVAKIVTGTLIDQKTEEPTEKVDLTLKNTTTKAEFHAESDDNGKFTFQNVPLGDYEFHVSDKDYNDNTFKIQLTEEHQNNYTFGTPIPVSLKVSPIFNWGDRKMKDANGKTIIKEHYWSHFTAKVILTIYGACLFLIFVYSLIQMKLAVTYMLVTKRRKKNPEPKPVFDPATAPKVTVQLPMYNELYVAERIIEAAAAFDYPADKLQIQVLDDSTDETKDIVKAKVDEIAATGVNIVDIHRVDRTGYKAGALDSAMSQATGDFIAIFDADFIPEKNFLKETIPYFQNPEIGVVQTRWGHLNKNYSMLTYLQAFGLDGHFAIEQTGRTADGHFINFNGTGGIWRKKCIEDAGGWEHDTLTEDLDLSYRAQIKGWKFKYLEDVVEPAELPITISALKNQQHRWMKGGAECFKKMWKRLLFAKGVRFTDRIHGLSHLFNSSVFLFIFTTSLLSLLVLQIKDSFSDLNKVLQFMGVFIISTVFLMFYYWQSYRDKTDNKFKSFFQFVYRFFAFLIMSMGLSLSNTVAVIEGYMGIKSSFVRTPKFNVSKKSEFKGNKYDKKRLSIINILEGVLMLVFGFTAINRAIYGDLGMVPFHLMLAVGYGIVFFATIAEIRTTNKAVAAAEAA